MHHSIKCLSVLWLCIGLVFISCQKNDPETPGPEIPGLQFDTTTYITTLQRDTANFAHLQMSVSLPDQIDRIEIYHTDPETPLDIIEKYRGMHLLEFDYPIDISDFLQDTTLIYTLKVYDMKAHCRHKTFIFHIKPFPHRKSHFRTETNYLQTCLYIKYGLISQPGQYPLPISVSPSTEKRKIFPCRKNKSQHTPSTGPFH